MARPLSDNDTHLHLQLPGALLEEAQELAPLLSEPGGPEYTRADVLRRALRCGLDKLKKDAERKRRR